MMSIEEWLKEVLASVHTKSPEDFAGLGLVFYFDRMLLPVHPLVQATDSLGLPGTTIRASVDILASISQRCSVFHDGFHLVDAAQLVLTDVSQFISPPIPSEGLVVDHTGGARHMAARLASMMSSVSAVAVCTTDSEVTLYKHGIRYSIRLKEAF